MNILEFIQDCERGIFEDIARACQEGGKFVVTHAQTDWPINEPCSIK